MDVLLRDVKFGLRVLAKSPGFSILAILTFALGVSASTAVFSVVNTILLKPLPFPDSSRIVMPWYIAPISSGFGNESMPWSSEQFVLYRRQTKAFQHLAAFQGDTFNYTGSGEPERLDGVRASADFFPVLGVAPALGRFFTPQEDQPGNEREVILSYPLWIRRFGGTNILGQSIRLNGYSYSVVGIMPSGFSFPRSEEMPATLDFHREPQLWVPLATVPVPHGSSDLAVIGRLRPGVTLGQVQGELNVLTKTLESLYPEGKGWFNCRLVSLAKQVAGDTTRPLMLMLGAVGLVLLIASSNVANLLLTRSIARTREFTMRSALGAEKGRLIRQLLTESLLLAGAGGLAGVLLAHAAIRLLKLFGPASIPRLREVHIDPVVLLFALGITSAMGVLFGLAPALSAGRKNLSQALRQGIQRSGSGHTASKLRNTLLVAEVALALVLVIAAGLLVRTFRSMLASDSGFRSAHVLTFELSAPLSKYPDADSTARLYRSVLAALHAAPGVRAAGLISYLPMSGAPDSTQIRMPERPVSNQQEQPFANYSFISRDGFAALGTPLLRGRAFYDSDTLSSMPVTIINSTMARKYWPGQDPLGKQVGVGSPQWPLRTIVGIVADIKHTSLREEVSPEMFVPFTQNEIKIWPSMQSMQFAVRANGDSAGLSRDLRKAVASVDAELPFANVSTLVNLVDNSLTQTRFTMLLVGSFGLLATLLACIGLYGVISYGVAQRTREIGLRVALGARREDVFRMVLSHSGRLVGMGMLCGLFAAFGVTRLMSAFLYGVTATDPVTLAAVSLLLIGVAFLATVFPAARATRVDPVIALRFD